MARESESTVVEVSENGQSVYLKAELTTDYAYPFDPGDDVAVHVLPHTGLVIVPEDSDFDPTQYNP